MKCSKIVKEKLLNVKNLLQDYNSLLKCEFDIIVAIKESIEDHLINGLNKYPENIEIKGWFEKHNAIFKDEIAES